MSVKSILITLPAPPKGGRSPYFDIAEKYKFEITFRPLIEVEAVSTREFRDQKVNILDHSAIVFTSRTAMERFFELCKALRVAMPEDMKYFCITEQVANYLQKFVPFRKRKIFYPSEGGTTASLVALIHKHNKERYFLPMAEEHTNDLIDALEAKKVKSSTAVMYRTVSVKLTEEEKAEKHDMILFFSPASITSLQDNFPNFDQGDIRFAAFGPSTARAIQEAGFRLDLSAPQEGIPSMPLALEKYLGAL